MRPLLTAVLLLSAQPALAETLTVRITGVKEAAGRLQVAVCNRSFDEAGCPYGASEAAMVPGTEIRFSDLPAGPYAVAVSNDIHLHPYRATLRRTYFLGILLRVEFELPSGLLVRSRMTKSTLRPVTI